MQYFSSVIVLNPHFMEVNLLRYFSFSNLYSNRRFVQSSSGIKIIRGGSACVCKCPLESEKFKHYEVLPWMILGHFSGCMQ